MKKALIILRMARWPNLLMMAAGLVLTRYCILLPVYSASDTALQLPAYGFLMLLLATLLIGAGGYVVNDILDAGLDEVNKPGANAIGKEIPEKLAWNIYYGLNIAGVGLGGILSYLAGKPELGILFLVIATSLYYYSLKYKYLPFWGNFVVAMLTATTVLIVWVFEFFFLKQQPLEFVTISSSFSYINRFVLGFSFLAFFTSFIRELAKDAQDKEGDIRFGCRTIPILLGDIRTRRLIMGLLAFSILLIAFIQYFLYASFIFLALYLFIVSGLAFWGIFHLLFTKMAPDYRLVSRITKAMLAAGLVSVLLLWFPN